MLCCIFLCSSSLAQKQDESIKQQVKQFEKLGNNELIYKKLDSLNRLPQLSPKALATVKLGLAKTAVKMQQYNEAVKLCYEGIELVKKTDLDTVHAYFYMVIGGVNYYLMKFPEAIAYFKKSAALAKEKNILAVEVNAYQNLGAVYIDNEQFDTGEKYLHQTITLSKSCGKPCARYRFMAYRLLATLYERQKKYAKSIKIFEQLEKEALLEKDTTLITSLLMFHGNVLSSTGKKQQAIQKGEMAVKLMRQYKGRTDDGFISALSFLAKKLGEAGNYKRAYELRNEAGALQQQRFKTANQQQVNEMETKFKVKEIEQQKDLAHANVLAETQKKKLLAAVLFGVILFFMLLSTIIYFRNRKKKAEAKIREQKAMVETILNTEEKERSRIAKDLHDGIVQDLAAIKLGLTATLQQASSLSLQQQLNGLLGNIDATTKEVREIAYQMMPLGLKELGLLQALTELFNRSFDNSNITFELNTFGLRQAQPDGLEHLERFPEKIEQTVYRICQELIQNTLKHSGANQVSLLLQLRNGTLQLTYEDNGTGFDASGIKKGIGLNSIASRVEMLKGSFEIDTFSSSGTTVFVRIPV